MGRLALCRMRHGRQQKRCAVVHVFSRSRLTIQWLTCVSTRARAVVGLVERELDTGAVADSQRTWSSMTLWRLKEQKQKNYS